MTRLTLVASLLAVLGIVGVARAEDLVDNPQYVSWAKHKPGTSVVMKMATNMGPQSMNMELTQTLKDLKPDQATIEVKSAMDMGGTKQNMPPQTLPVKAKVTPSEAKLGQLPPGFKGDIKEVGTETVTVGGKSYECKVAEVTSEGQGMKSHGKIWRNDDVPGQMVKMEMSMEGAQSGTISMELVSVDAK